MFLGIREENKIRELHRVIFEMPEKKSELRTRKKREIETEWELLGGGSKKMNSADPIGQLAALRFKTQMGRKNLSRGKSEEISENGMPGKRKEIPQVGAIADTAIPPGKLKFGRLRRMGVFCESHMRIYVMANP